MPALVSQDGRWFWDGTRWRSRVVDAPLDTFWFTSTQEWQGRILVTGLIALIPIVGAINTLGWTLVAVDMIRQGWKELPPAGFHYLERGVPPFVISLVYGLVVLFVVIALVVAGLFAVFAKQWWPVVGVVLLVLAAILLVAWWLVSLFLTAAILIGSDRLGLGRAFNPAVLVRLARQNFDASVHVALIYFLGGLVVGTVGLVIGLIVPFGGLIISIALPAIYAIAVPRLASFEVPAPAALPPGAQLDTRTA